MVGQSGDRVSSKVSWLREQGAADVLEYVSTCEDLEQLPFPERSCDVIFFTGLRPSPTLLRFCTRLLVGNGRLSVELDEGSGDVSSLSSDLVLSGLLKVSVDAAQQVVSGVRAPWDSGAVSLLGRGRKSVPSQPEETAASSSAAATASVSWKQAAAGPAGEEDMLVEEEELVDEDTLYQRPTYTDSNGAPKSKGACKNCTCGKADRVTVVAEEEAPKSSCGSCYLGDAFRCADCPYTGLPPFQPGERVQIKDSMLMDMDV